MMKIRYEAPETEVAEFKMIDVLTASDTDLGGVGDAGDTQFNP